MTSKTPKTRLERAIAHARSIFLVVGFFSLFINLLMLTGPLYMLQVYDRVLTSGSMDTLIALTILALGLLMSQAFLEYVRSRILIRFGNRLDEQINAPLMNVVVAHNKGKEDVSAAQSLRDLESYKTFLTGRGLTTIFDAPWTPLFLAVIFLMHPLLGIVATGGALILILLTGIGEIVTRARYREARANSLIAERFADASLRNAEAIEAMGMMPAILERWSKYHNASQFNMSHAGHRSAAITAMAKFFRPSLQVAMLGFGAWLVLRGEITAGVMVAASIIMGRALAPVEGLISQWRQFGNVKATYRRLNELLAVLRQDDKNLPLPRPKGDLAVESLVAVPPGQKKAVIQNVNFKIDAGDVLGIIGPSAAGKSSLARLLVGAWHPVSGQVRLDGANVAKWQPNDRGPFIGYLPQDVELFEGTVSENIARMDVPDQEKVLAAANEAGAHELILYLADGYDTQIGPGGNVLSAGQRQRIGLARALYGEPSLIVLDEPNANLDQNGEQALRAAIMQVKKAGRTVVMIAHHTNILTVCDKLLVLRNGRVEQFGPKDEIVANLARTAPNTSIRPVRAVES